MPNFITFLQYEFNLQALVTYFCKIFEKIRKCCLRTQNVFKKMLKKNSN